MLDTHECADTDWVSFSTGKVLQDEGSWLIPTNACVVLSASDFQDGELNVPTALIVQGHLKLDPDATSTEELTLVTPFLVVAGRFHIGSRSVGFGGKFTIVLIPSTDGTSEDFVWQVPIDTPVQEFDGSFTAVDSTSHQHSLGTKGMAVVGGELIMNGWDGDVDEHSWGRLAATANAGSNVLYMRDDVTEGGGWRAGDTIVIATTDEVADHTEKHIILQVSTDGATSGLSVITLETSLLYTHWGEVLTYGDRSIVNMSAEVGLLSRNIRIVTRREDDPGNPLMGGHFGVFHTLTPQYIDGVEFVRMGQQGLIGRYPIHFHMSLDHTGSLIRRCSVHETIQRGIVIHGTTGTHFEIR
jgi:hypothetical protein